MNPGLLDQFDLHDLTRRKKTVRQVVLVVCEIDYHSR